MNLNKNLLLPHGWQIAGWWMLAVSVILSIGLIAGDISDIIHNVPAIIGWIPFYIGAMLVCLSREKVDDEYISAIRGRIVCILVSIALIAKVLYIIITILNITYGWSSHSTLFAIINGRISILSYITVLYQPLFLVATYIIAFKLTLLIQNRRIRYAEQ